MHRVFICIAAAVLCAACGGGGGANSPVGISDFDVQVTPAQVVVARGLSTSLRVDLRGQTRPDAPVGYAFDFDEVAAHIDVATAPCPSGVGTIACQDWTITAGENAVPGRYLVLVRAVGTRFRPSDTDETTARFDLIVTAPPPSRGAVFVDGNNGTDALVITEDGALWGNGKNQHAQIDLGYTFEALPQDTPPNDGRPDGIRVQPVSSAGFARVHPRITGRWSTASVDDSTRFAVQAVDGSLWGWGGNTASNHELGLPENARGVESVPVQIPGVSGVVQIAQGFSGTLVRTLASGSVYAIGGPRPTSSQTTLFGATPVPASGSTTDVVALTGVASLGGAASVYGRGFGVAAKFDGSVWLWGARPYLSVATDGTVSYDPGAFPQRVTDLPADIAEVAGTDRGAHAVGTFVARTASGLVWEGGADFAASGAGGTTESTFSLRMAASVQVPGLTDVVEVSIGRADSNSPVGETVALARLGDGTVFAWIPGETSPRRIAGIPPAIRIGRGHLISGDCSGPSGAVWKVRVADAATTAAPIGTFGFRNTSCESQAGRLTVNVSGPGRVHSIAALIDCGNVCSNTFPLGSEVTLLGVPEQGYQVSYPDTPTCRQRRLNDDTFGTAVGEDTQCAVTFSATPSVRVVVQPYGQGTVSSSPAGIDCGSTCSADFPLTGRTSGGSSLGPTTVRLTPQPDAGWRVASFQGTCDRNGVISIPGDFLVAGQTYACNVLFERIPTSATLTLARTGTGTGSVASDPAGIDCGSTCSAEFGFNSLVHLQAAPAAGSSFAGWEGDADCRDALVRADGPKTCVASFSLILPPAAPSNFRGVAAASSVELAWDRNSAVTTYELTRTPGSNGAASRTFVFAGPADQYVDGTVNADTLYRYELVARNEAGSSAAVGTSVRTTIADNWTRVGSNDIDAAVGFGQPALALTADGNDVAVAQVVTGAVDAVNVFVNDAFAPTPWTRLDGTPGASIVPTAAGTQPSLALDAQGAPLVAWTQATANGNDVRVARYNSQTAQWTLLGSALDVDLGSVAQNDATQPVMALSATDRLVVAWLQGGSAFAKRWNGSTWVPVGDATGIPGSGATINAVKLLLDEDGTAYLLVRRGSGAAAQLFGYRESGAGWTAIGGALNAPLAAPRATLSFFELIADADGAPLAVWSEGIAPHRVLASRWSGGAWQRLPDVVNADSGDYAITGLAAARSVQAATIQPSPPHVMVATQAIFNGANHNVGFGDVYFLNAGTWVSRPTLLTRGPMLGLTLRVTRQATPVAAWIAETGAIGSGELRLFVWSSLF